MKREVVWRTNYQNQLSLLPLSYDDLVAINHSVCIVNTDDFTNLKRSFD
ncbi:hypothetical protein [uncultured Aquimarina sp.]|nr:hypothetical protein [uncultured Aquimarina sp.]